MKKTYKKITRQLGFTYFFTALIFLTSPLLTFVLTRKLTVQDFGVYSIFAVTIAFMTVVLDLGLSNYIVTKLSGLPRRLKASNFVPIFLFSLLYLILLFILVVASPLNKKLLSLLNLEAYLIEATFAWIIILTGVLFRIFNAYFESKQEIEFSSLNSFIKQSFWVYILVFIVLRFGKISLQQLFGIWVFGVLISVVLALFVTRNDFLKFIKTRKTGLNSISKALKFSLPLLPFIVGTWIIQVSDRYILKVYTDLSTVGIYNLGYTLVGFVLGFATVITYVVYPYYSKSWNNKKNYHFFENISIKYILMTVLPMLVGLMILRNALVTLISGPDYQEAASVIIFLILFPVFGSLNLVFLQPLMLKNRTKLIGIIYALGGILNIVLNLILIPIYGMKGAALVTTASYLFTFVITYYFARKDMKYDKKFIRSGRIILSAVLMAIIVYMINPTTAVNKVLTIFVGIITYVLGIFIFKVLTKSEIKFILELIDGFKAKVFKLFGIC